MNSESLKKTLCTELAVHLLSFINLIYISLTKKINEKNNFKFRLMKMVNVDIVNVSKGMAT